MKQKLVYTVLFLLLPCMLMMTTSCTKENLDFDKLSCDTCLSIDKTVTWSFPLMSTTVVLNDLLDNFGDDVAIMQKTTGAYFYEATDTFFRSTLSDFAPAIMFPPRLDAVISSDTNIIDTTIYVPFTIADNVRLKQLGVQSGRVLLDIQWRSGDTATITASLPNSKVMPASKQFSDNALNRGRDTLQFLLTNELVNLGNNPSQNYNNLAVNLRIAVPSGRIPLTTIRTSFVDAEDTTKTTIDWFVLSGFLGNKTLPIPIYMKSLDLDIIAESPKLSVGNFNFSGSFIEFQTVTSMGIPLKIELDALFFLDKVQRASREIPFYSNYPSDINGLNRFVNTTRREIDGIDDIFSLPPDSLSVSGNILINDSRSPNLDTNQFLYSNSIYNITMKQHIPVTFSSFDSIRYRDTLDNNISIDTSMLILEESVLYVQGINKFPFDMGWKLLTVDSTGVVTDVIILAQDIPSAKTDASGNTIEQENNFQQTFFLSKSQISNIISSESMVLDFVVRKNDERNELISFSNTNSLQIGLGLDISVRLKTN